MNRVLLIALISFFSIKTYAQGHISGELMMNSNFYINDTVIGTNTTQYKRELSSADVWLMLNYWDNNDFSARVRFDAFFNTPLFNPQEAYSAQGLRFIQLKKKIDKLTLTGGNFYDQYGNGIIFRAFEDRTLGIDFSIQGARVEYELTPTLRLHGFAGRQLYRFEYKNQPILGGNIEKDFFISDDLQIYTGVAGINRTLDQSTMSTIADEINGYPDVEDRFIPKYNVYAFTAYSNVFYKNLGLSFEYAHKTEEAIRNFTGSRLISRNGYCIYTNVNYSFKGFGLSFQYRKNQDFVLRTSPYTGQFEGIISYLPPITRQQSLRLPGRYSPQSLNFGEEGYQFDLTYSPDNKNTFSANISYVNNGRDDRLFSAPIIALSNDQNTPAEKLYNEFYVDYYRRWSRKFKTLIGVQSLTYDRDVYQGKPGALMVRSFSPFTEITYKLDRRKSLRLELQYLRTDQDMGDFAFALLEFNIAPRYSISISDMVNTEPRENSILKSDQSYIHYPTIFGAYTLRQTRFTLGYIKQVEGVVCTGGVCRVEPAFSGVRFGLTTNF